MFKSYISLSYLLSSYLCIPCVLQLTSSLMNCSNQYQLSFESRQKVSFYIVLSSHFMLLQIISLYIMCLSTQMQNLLFYSYKTHITKRNYKPKIIMYFILTCEINLVVFLISSYGVRLLWHILSYLLFQHFLQAGLLATICQLLFEEILIV